MTSLGTQMFAFSAVAGWLCGLSLTHTTRLRRCPLPLYVPVDDRPAKLLETMAQG
jgi:hypothetical protein